MKIYRSQNGDPLRLRYYPHEPMTQTVDGDRRNMYIKINGALEKTVIFQIEQRFPY